MANIKPAEIERSAYHIAGHIFIHLLTGIELTEANIIENNKQLHMVIHDNYDFIQNNDKELRDDIIMCLRSGSLAEKYYCWINCIIYDSKMSGNDIWQISRLYYEGAYKLKWQEGFENHINNLEIETERLIKVHWSFIEIIAQNLLKNRKLTVEEINESWKDHLMKK